MSVLELKQAISKLKKSERQELFAYMVRLKHETSGSGTPQSASAR